MVIRINTPKIVLEDLVPKSSDRFTVFSDWAGEKAKDCLDAFANVSFYLSKVPTLY